MVNGLAMTGDYINSPDEIEIIPGVGDRLQKYADDGWQIAIVSNQGGVEKRVISLEDCVKGFIHTMDLLPVIAACYFCPNAAPSEGLDCYRVGAGDWGMANRVAQGLRRDRPFRKPNPGMLTRAIEDFGATRVIYVGDRPEDQGAAQSAGVPFVWANEFFGWGKED